MQFFEKVSSDIVNFFDVCICSDFLQLCLLANAWIAVLFFQSLTVQIYFDRGQVSEKFELMFQYRLSYCLLYILIFADIHRSS